MEHLFLWNIVGIIEKFLITLLELTFAIMSVFVRNKVELSDREGFEVQKNGRYEVLWLTVGTIIWAILHSLYTNFVLWARNLSIYQSSPPINTPPGP